MDELGSVGFGHFLISQDTDGKIRNRKCRSVTIGLTMRMNLHVATAIAFFKLKNLERSNSLSFWREHEQH